MNQPLSTVERVKRTLLAMQRKSWEQGVAAQAFLEAGDLDLVGLMARDSVVHQQPDGRLALVEPPFAVTDPGAMGEALLFAAKHIQDSALRRAADQLLHYLLVDAPRTADGILYHVTNAPEIWIDCLYMAPPFLAVAGYSEEAIKQIEGVKQRLWDPESRLYSHIWDEGQHVFRRRAFWGTGQGWAASGITRVIAALPASMAREKASLAAHVQDIIDGCLAHRRPDNRFYDVVDDPTSFAETNLGQMLAYTIYRGTYEGWLDSKYRPIADELRAAAQTMVDSAGFVQEVCGAPRFDHSGTSAEGQAFYLLMESAYARTQNA
jgi:rhamnogalacturonyl hydrolase YesR